MDTSLDPGLPAIKPNSFEIVVAHFNEDLSWLKLAAREAIVYVKGIVLDVMCCKQTGIAATNVKHYRKSTEREKLVSGNDSASQYWSRESYLPTTYCFSI